MQNDRQINNKLDLLLEVFSEIKMNYTENQEVINEFIDSVCKISECVNSDFWQGEDVMGIFFNEFNRYKKKSDNGQVFTPDHITSLMYRIIDINANDYVFDGACGSGAFLVKAMSNMIKEVGGVNASKAKTIKENHLYGIEFDREIYALACANMMIHKDGKTNLAQLDTRSDEAKEWIKTKLSEGASIKVLMNPPFERKYGCMKIVQNILDSVPTNSKCAFILPDKKLEKDNGKKLLQ
ncbi:HsdM family class I SAM-dependent methyltransferase, partial [Campylobacter upsaliensis]|uniref:HsdM family class I SAM-dependent methyltransferase n=1 Tax=Campylobacter upsaliensis TaxID=28080 RepID=UPI001BD978D2